jgi:RNA 2',3'-cyclic 3'-phosphodiesterase
MKRRIFVAIDISAEARRKVSAYVETSRREFPHLRVGWEKTEKLHLTLKFLGDTDEAQLENLNKTVREIAEKNAPFKLRISGPGVFPSAKKARVLWIGLSDEKGSLAQINQPLETGCEKIGFAREKGEFKPHLTIARLREPQKSRDLVWRHLETKFEPVEFEVAEIVIYESRLQPTGSVYSVVSKFKLEKQNADDADNADLR